MAEAEAGLELPIGLTEQKFLQQLARIEARSIKTANKAEAAFKQSNASAAKSFAGLERSAAGSLRNMQSLFRVGAGFLAGGFAAQQFRQFTRLADAATKMRNSLRVVGLEGDGLNAVYGELYKSAQQNAAPIESLVDLYSKLSLAQDTLGVSSQDLIKFTDGISVALRVGGTDAQAASGSLLQLSQALGGGVVRAEEFNSILEGTPTIARAVAKGLKEAGGSVSTLRTLVTDGQVSSSAFFKAFQVGSEELRAQADTSQTTVGQAFVRIGNSLLTVVGEFDKATGASGNFADTLSDVASGIDGLDVSGLISKIQAVIDIFSEAERAGTSWLNSVGNSEIFARLNEASGVTEGGQIVNPDVSEAEAKISALEKEVGTLQAQIENNTELGFDNSGAIARLGEVRSELAALRAEAAGLSRFVDGIRPDGSVVRNMSDSGAFYDGSNYAPPPPAPAPAGPVSIADFPAAPKKPKKPGGGSGRKRGGRSSSKEKTAADILVLGEDDLRDLERQVQLIGKSSQEAATLQSKWAMLDAAKKAGIPVNDQLNAQIDAQAAQVGQLTAELERAQIAQDQFDQAIDGIADSFAGALVAGESLREGLANVFRKIAADLINSGIRSAMSSVFGGFGGGSLFGSIFGGLFGGGDALTTALRGAGLPARANGGPVSAGTAYMVGERGPEPFVPAVDGRILSVAQAQSALRGGQGATGGNGAVDVRVFMDENGSWQARVEQISGNVAARTVATNNKTFSQRVQRANARPRER